MLDDHIAFSENPQKHMATAIAYMQSALKYAQTYIDTTPIDDRLLRAVISRYLCLFPAIKGPAHVDPKLSKLTRMVERLRLSERLSGTVWSPIVQTTPRATWQLIYAHYAKAAAEWDPVFAGRNEVRVNEAGKDAEKVAQDGLEDLVERLCGGLKHGEVNADEESWNPHVLHPRLDETMLELPTCSYCGNPSAQCKKCGRCGGVRYCDEKCQKLDWKVHKPQCKAGELVKASTK